MGLGRCWRPSAGRVEAGPGRVGPSRALGAEWGRLGLSGVGEGLGMHWDQALATRAEWGRVGPSRAG